MADKIGLGNSVFVKSNIKLSVEFTNDNLSRKFVEHGTFPFNHIELSHNCAKRRVKAWADFSTGIGNLWLYTV